MKLTKIFCDRCKREINDVLYTLTCYAEDVNPSPLGGVSADVMSQNMRQNLLTKETHLCRDCKDKITDGIFIV